MPTPTVIINPTVSIQFTGQAIVGGPANIVTPGPNTYQATATFYESYFPAGSSATTFAFAPTGATFIPIVYVKNVDLVNLLTVNLFTVGLGNHLTLQLNQGSYFFLFNTTAAKLGIAASGIDSGAGLTVNTVVGAGTCACEIFLAI